MQGLIRSIFAVVPAVFATVVLAANVTLSEVVKGVNVDDNTKLAARDYWNSVKGKEVTWSGEVAEVKGTRGEAHVYVADKSQPLYKGFNVIVKTHDIEKAGKLKKGQKVRFTGALDRYKQKKVGAVITLGDGRLL